MSHVLLLELSWVKKIFTCMGGGECHQQARCFQGWQQVQATIGDATLNNVWVTKGNHCVTANGLILHFEIVYFVISNKLFWRGWVFFVVYACGNS